MIPNMKMCRESRIILEELDILANTYGVTNLVTPYHVYMADKIVLKYYTNPVINMIRSKMKNIKKKSSKHFTSEYWFGICETLFKDNINVKRENYIYDREDAEAFSVLSGYMLTDYGVNECKIIHMIIAENTTISIRNAINIATKNNVYNIMYVKTILDRNNAERNIGIEGIKKTVLKIDKSSKILDEQKVLNTPLDIATAQYNWKQAQDNAILEQKMRQIMGD